MVTSNNRDIAPIQMETGTIIFRAEVNSGCEKP